MHMVIRVLVYAQDHEEALEQARAVAGGLVEEGVFDYAVDFTQPGFMVAGADRWGPRPYALPVHTDRCKWYIMAGLDDVMAAFSAMKRDFMADLMKVEFMIEKYSGEDLFEEMSEIPPDPDDPRDHIVIFRHYCLGLGQYKGPNVWLYDQDGAGIRDSRTLAAILDHWGGDYPDQLFVVPFDVHF